jgi:hypothetical protein
MKHQLNAIRHSGWLASLSSVVKLSSLCAGLLAALALLGPGGTARAGTIALLDSTPLVGNQEFDGPLGMDFDVGWCSAVRVTRLGTFDSGQDGIKRAIKVYLYDRDTQSLVAGPIAFAPGDDDTLVGDYRFKEPPARRCWPR